MGSVLLDSVNSFFGHHSHQHSHAHPSPSHPQHSVYREPSAPRAHSSSSPQQHARRSRTPSRSEASHMSDSAQRTPSSSAAAPTPRSAAQSHDAQEPQQTSERRWAAQPPSPTLGARPAPPPPDGSQITVLGASVTADARSTRPRKIKVRDLEHIQSFATEDMGSFSEIRSRSRSRSRGTAGDGPRYEISEMKVEHIIEMVAGLLTKITTTNDRQHEHIHRQPPNIDAASHLNPQTSSVLAFHGKNVPSITILSYLSRINKYCPTSYEVFLSLLVYFDRMTERVNAGRMQTLREQNQNAVHESMRSASAESFGPDGMEGVTATIPSGTQQATPPYSGGNEKAVGERGIPGTPHSTPNQSESSSVSPTIDCHNLSHFFVVDSFNIHRLVIAGVTCASKFFSDIFYTNSRYAKVGGLPLRELNHLELQFLLLNDFRLSIPAEEIEAYGTMLVEFYAREVVAQQKANEVARKRQQMQMRSLSESSNESTATVRAAG